MAAYLTIDEQVFSLKELENSIGRHKTSDIKIRDGRVSKFHAALIQADNGYLIVDRGSLNGTYIDGKRIKSQLLINDKKIRIGATMCYFHSEVTERSLHSPRSPTLNL